MFTDRLVQSRLARAAGVSQPRVSQVISQLRAFDLVRGKGKGLRWDRAALLEAFLDNVDHRSVVAIGKGCVAITRKMQAGLIL